ncbi:MAG: peptidoglycan editing factor PgeF [Alphaproteobacteria bacterium]|nr:peptidoglycan editing factor PgeF [Alphaproteobacteria bacterium]
MSYISGVLPEDKHCFFGVEGGVSTGKYASLNTNLSSKDSPDNVYRNFTIISEYFKKRPEDMFTLRQSVSNIAVIAEKASWFEISADGAVTTDKNILLGIKTADCAPVLLADYKNGVIGAAHAGWRGAYRGIVENVVKLMCYKGAKVENIAACIGPCMQQASFEVKDDMRQVLCDIDKSGSIYFKEAENKNHFHFDLSGYVEAKLRKIGIDNIDNSRIDTYPLQNGYFSYRRNTHLDLITYPRDYPTQYSCICL